MASLDTNFNASPYFDDYDEEKNFHRILFRPAVPVQARELTQLQTILQNQVERFGDNIYKQGTIIKGCTFAYDFNYEYIKIRDLQVDGQTAIPSSYFNLYATDPATGLNSIVVNYVNGLESQDPNTNILYVKYLNTGTGETKKFANNSSITLFQQDYRMVSVRVDGGGSSYTNSDFLTFTGGGGTGAAANVITYSNSSIRTIVFTNFGTGYTTAPSVAITTATGSGASLTPINYVAQVTVANSSFTANSTTPVGTGTAVIVSDGVIYQKGHFVRVEEQTVIVDKFTNSPNNVVLGFYTQESIVNSSSDSTLLDNAQGYSNYTAPGAHRLKLTPQIQAITKEEAQANTDFFKLVEFENGRVTKRKTETEFNSIDKKLSQRTAEESGDYVVSPFGISTEEISGNTTHINVVVGSGVGYVDGSRVEINASTRIPTRQGTDTETSFDASIATNYGNYVIVKECHGVFNFASGATVNLRDTAATDVTDNFGGGSTTPGSLIGTAKIRSIVYDSGTIGSASAVYRLYLFGIVMSPGRRFAAVRSVELTGGVADIVLDANGNAVLTDTDFDTLVFPSGFTAVKSVANVNFIYRAVYTANTLSTSGATRVELTGAYDKFPYTINSTLSSVQETEFVVIPTANAIGGTNLSGTVTSSGNVITGTSTNFTSQLAVGDHVKFSGNTTLFKVTAITGPLSMTVNGTTGPVVSSNTLTLAFPANIPIRLDRTSANIAIDSTGTKATIYIGNTVTSSTPLTVIHNVKVSPGAASIHKTKTVKKSVYVKLSTNRLTANTKGPWSLGIPDAFKLNAVYVGTSNTYSNTTTNYASSFQLVNGQSDNLYGLAALKFKPGSTLSLTGTNNLLVSVDVFTHSSGYYLSTSSYPVNDTGTYNDATDIKTSDIPRFKSPKTGVTYSLRDVIDFRPIVANTANANATTVAGASIDPSSTEVISGVVYFPAPNDIFEADVDRFLPRSDLIVLDRNNNILIKEGVPGVNLTQATVPDKAMSLGTLFVPPFPSLSPRQASRAKRSDYSTLVRVDQVKRYTMKDIKQIEQRLASLEYYSLLNTLEKDTKDLVIPSEANSSISRFKNGFFVDPMNSYDIADVNNAEFNFLIDTRASYGTAPVNQLPIELTFNSGSSSGVVKKGDNVMLDYSHVETLKQPLATRFRNIAGLAWSYDGTMKLFPEYDNYYDTSQTALNFTVDIATPINALIDSFNENAVFKGDGKNITKVTKTDWVQTSFNMLEINERQTTTSVGYNQKTNLQTGGITADTVEVGGFSAISDFNPFIRSQEVYFCVKGLRPGARHYVFFDNVGVSNSYTESSTGIVFKGAQPGVLTSIAGISSTESLEDNNNYSATGSYGSNLVANSTGGLAGSFWIPEGRFNVGQREVLITDVDAANSIDTSVSKASVFFNAYNFKKTDVTLSMTTKAPTDITAVVSKTPFVETSSTTRTRRRDPLAQTFNINFDDGGDGCFITKVDLYFKQKSTTAGLTVQIRETVNGYPGATVLASKLLDPQDITVSSTGQTATVVTFDTPVFVRNDIDYCIALVPDQSSPDFLVWTSVTGKPDVFTNLVDNGDFGNGVLFISSNDKVWTPIQNEDLKFTLYHAGFTSTSGTVVMNNSTQEFLTLSGIEGSFIATEQVAQKTGSYIGGATLTGNTTSKIVNTSVSLTSSIQAGDRILLIYGTNKTAARTGTVSNSTLTTITGSGTSFNTDYAAGDYILIGTSVREVVSVANSTQLVIDAQLNTAASGASHFGVTESYQVNRVVSANTTAIVFKNNLEVVLNNSTNYAGIQKVVSGRVISSGNENKLYIRNSNAANNSFLFEATKKIVGSSSGATATISSVDDYTVNYVEPYLSTISPSGTSITMTQSIVGTSAATSAQNISFGVSNKTLYEAEIRSRSNEISTFSGNKSFTLTSTFNRTSSSNKISPVIDISPASIVVLQSKINNVYTNETTRYGDAAVKYISKSVTLADGLDAEDMKFYVTAYKPSGTGVLVYAKVLSNGDGDDFQNKDWSLMTQDTEAGLFSDSGDDEDYIEYAYSLARTPPATRKEGRVATNSNTTITGTSTTFSTDFAAGDLIKLVNSSTTTDYEIAVVSAVASDTSLTISAALGPYSTTSATGLTVEKVDQPQAAFKYAYDNNIVRYYDANQSARTTYKVYAIKVVLVSSSSQYVPKIKDIRALAVSV